eukprot:2986039-Alexandrium_andersonii.AAC.1
MRARACVRACGKALEQQRSVALGRLMRGSRAVWLRCACPVLVVWLRCGCSGLVCRCSWNVVGETLRPLLFFSGTRGELRKEIGPVTARGVGCCALQRSPLLCW